MSSEQIKKLQKYESLVRSKIDSPTPVKHAHRDCSYRQYLARELAAVSAKIAQAKLESK